MTYLALATLRRRSYDIIRTDRTEPTEKMLQEKLNPTIPTWN